MDNDVLLLDSVFLSTNILVVLHVTEFQISKERPVVAVVFTSINEVCEYFWRLVL